MGKGLFGGCVMGRSWVLLFHRRSRAGEEVSIRMRFADGWLLVMETVCIICMANIGMSDVMRGDEDASVFRKSIYRALKG